MTATFSGSLPENYDRYLGPILFADEARDVARRIPARDGIRVLEVACGTGIVTREIARRVPASASIVATDLFEPMIVEAQRHLHDGRVTWRTADATRLAFDDGSFDVYVCQFAIMLIPDREAVAREAARVLRRGGVALVSVLDAIERNDIGRVFEDAARKLVPHDPPRFVRAVYSMADADQLRNVLVSNGFADAAIDTVEFQARGASAEDLARGLATGTPVANELRERGVDPAQFIAGLAAEFARELGDPPRARITAHIATARR